MQALVILFAFGQLSGGTVQPVLQVPSSSLSSWAVVGPVIAAAGDIACDPTDPSFNGGNGTTSKCHELYTSNLLVNGTFKSVLVLGDEQYECGGYEAFRQSYDPSWGRVRAISHPVPGNHEYETGSGTDCRRGAAGYFQYFGSAARDPNKGYYGFDIGTWHIIALNTNCSFVSCAKGSPQERWLSRNLANHPSTCTLAFGHHPRFSSGSTQSQRARSLLRFWKDLYSARADVFLTAHRHFYERFSRLAPSGQIDPRGVRQFIVGTGGKSLASPTIAAAGSVFRDGTHYGILELSLGASHYSWQFVAENGTVIDSGSDTCIR